MSQYANNHFFSCWEFDSPDKLHSGELMNHAFIKKLTAARMLTKSSFSINSGYRSLYHNILIGGKSDSSHLRGLACDIEVTNSRNRHNILTSLLKVGFNRIGIGKNFIHVDIDLSKSPRVVWVYSPKQSNF